MPTYYSDANICSKSMTDDEKKQKGFLSGDCITSAITKFTELIQKFGNHFDIVCQVNHRNTSSMVRLMNEEQAQEFMDKGKYLIHFIVYNKKTKQYIDTSNNSVQIVSEAFQHSRFHSQFNRIYKLYHFPLEWICKYHSSDIGAFCCNTCLRQHTEPFSEKEDYELMEQGVTIIIQ